mgnify:CR=1 FL=1
MFRTAFTLGLCLVAAGCQTPGAFWSRSAPAPNPMGVAFGNDDVLWERTVDVLHDYQFQIVREDRLARVIETGNQMARIATESGQIEVWQKLRRRLQVELTQIHRDVGTTFVYVTHDQEEAMSMATRIAVMNHGRIEQVGTPAEMYERPATRFVAGFVGTANILEGAAAQAVSGAPEAFTIRPEKIHLADLAAAAGPDERSALGHVREVVYLGSDTRYLITLDTGGELVVTRQNLTTTSMEAVASAFVSFTAAVSV